MLSYIILAHKDPDQVKRLVNRLDHINTFFYIHIDRKVDITPFRNELAGRDNVFFLKDEDRCVGVWGDMSLVNMALNAVRYIIKDKREGHCVLLSGQDYPLRPPQAIARFFEENKKINFISFGALPYAGWGDTNGMDRIEHYKIRLSTERTNNSVMLPTIYTKPFYSRSSLAVIKHILFSPKWFELVKIFIPRKLPAGLKPFGGDAWWAFNIETAKSLLEFIDSNPGILRFGKYTKLPDEVIIHTIIANKIQQQFLDHGVTYIKWKTHDSLSPENFTSADLDELKEAAGRYLFARKFEKTIDAEILNAIDNELLLTNESIKAN